MKLKDNKAVNKELRIKLAYCLCQPLLTCAASLPGPDRPPADLSRLKGKHFASGDKKGGKRGWQEEKTCRKEKRHKNFKQVYAVRRVLVRGSMFQRLPHESSIVVHCNCSTVY